MPQKDESIQRPPETPQNPAKTPVQPQKPGEVGGRDGLEPTRYGDWEKGGRVSDF
jgi:hypothetical protein